METMTHSLLSHGQTSVHAMETRRNLPRTKSLSSRNHGKMTSETLNFRKVARQVMLANTFTRKQPNVQSVMSAKMAAGVERHARTKTERTHSTIVEKPPLQRRGTPELFPMSEEMKQTVISLGKLDLLPDEERKNREDEARLKKSRAGSKFRDKTRQRIIHPQRFIRNVRNSLHDSKSIAENDEQELNEEDNDFKGSPEDKGKCFSNETSDGVLIRTKSNCNVLSRPQSTHLHTAVKSRKSQHCQYYSLTRRPFYVTSDLGPVSAKTGVRRTRSQGTWPVLDTRISSMRTQHYFPRNGKNTVKAWTVGSDISRSTEGSDKDSHEIIKARRWKSVESLTREIEEKCSSWLENRYGIIQSYQRY